MDADALLAGLRNRKLKSTKPPSPIPSSNSSPSPPIVISVPIPKDDTIIIPIINTIDNHINIDTKLTISDLNTELNSPVPVVAVAVEVGVQNDENNEKHRNVESVVGQDKDNDILLNNNGNSDNVGTDTNNIDNTNQPDGYSNAEVEVELDNISSNTHTSTNNININGHSDYNSESDMDTNSDTGTGCYIDDSGFRSGSGYDNYCINPVVSCRPQEFTPMSRSGSGCGSGRSNDSVLSASRSYINTNTNTNLSNHPIVLEINHLRSTGAVSDYDLIHCNPRYTLKYLSASGYGVDALHRHGGFTAYAMKHEGHFSASELLASGCYMLTELKRVGYTAIELRPSGVGGAMMLNAGYTVSNLISGGFSIHELRVGCRVQAKVLKELNIPVSVLIESGYSGADLYRAEK